MEWWAAAAWHTHPKESTLTSPPGTAYRVPRSPVLIGSRRWQEPEACPRAEPDDSLGTTQIRGRDCWTGVLKFSPAFCWCKFGVQGRKYQKKIQKGGKTPKTPPCPENARTGRRCGEGVRARGGSGPGGAGGTRGAGFGGDPGGSGDTSGGGSGEVSGGISGGL